MSNFAWGVAVGAWMTFAFGVILGSVLTAALLRSHYHGKRRSSEYDFLPARHNRWTWANKRHDLDALRSRAKDN